MIVAGLCRRAYDPAVVKKRRCHAPLLHDLENLDRRVDVARPRARVDDAGVVFGSDRQQADVGKGGWEQPGLPWEGQKEQL